VDAHLVGSITRLPPQGRVSNVASGANYTFASLAVPVVLADPLPRAFNYKTQLFWAGNETMEVQVHDEADPSWKSAPTNVTFNMGPVRYEPSIYYEGVIPNPFSITFAEGTGTQFSLKIFHPTRDYFFDTDLYFMTLRVENFRATVDFDGNTVDQVNSPGGGQFLLGDGTGDTSTTVWVGPESWEEREGKGRSGQRKRRVRARAAGNPG
jgi:hypothetical protein